MRNETGQSSLPNLSSVDGAAKPEDTAGRQSESCGSAKPQGQVDMTYFPVYFASIYAMQFHPGAGTRGHRPLSARQCALEALDMCRLEEELKQCL